ncbi:GIY-YIG nuclease family protein [Phormidium sp. FACHB-592]|uniref:GIY-YIG nuclease family protein n=1 Tax=Stenomitos frigidus AS-A4 TaxID=2933935 RepID=A0ABV0KKQ7_9CYAN|nr:GIY-YIG nuclease family protein [Phormidium sp. FACHB-592]MBD2077017.1 GIY-YIG nuclease family protein [Phormidium sp. FACHB-592]
MSHFVYLVQCADGTLYTGYAKDVQQRVAVHNTSKGARYTRSRLPVVLLASWYFPTKSAALKREYQIKQLNRQQKLELSKSSVPFNIVAEQQ